MRHTSRVNMSHLEVAAERLVSDASNYTMTMYWEMNLTHFPVHLCNDQKL